jgi:hypothetical protein
MKHSDFLGLGGDVATFDDQILESAFALNAAATQDGEPALDQSLVDLLAAFDIRQGLSPTEMVLVGLVRQLASTVATLAKTSTHPHAEALRTHRTLIDLQADMLPDEAAAWLQRATTLNDLGASISALLNDGSAS